jgi:erythrin-vacuolar iron transport family protein
MRDFTDLSEREILALAIGLEEEHGRIYADYAEGLRDVYPASAQIFVEMAAEEHEHRRQLIDLYAATFGAHIPLIRRQDVRGFVVHEPIWALRPLGLDKVRSQASAIEDETRRFYESAAGRATTVSVRKLLGDLAEAEREHVSLAQRLDEDHLTPEVRKVEDQEKKRQFVLQVVQPGLAGLMDGSVSTLAPVFAAAFATHNTWQTFLVGLAASVGAGISMGMTEAMSDDGKISGRGSPVMRGVITGGMTMLGGLGHALPYLIPNFWVATWIAIGIVFVELWVIAWIRSRYMDTKFLRAAFEVVVGGAIVCMVGIFIGST